MKLTLSTLDICEIFIYLIFMLCVGGWYFLTKNKTTNEFMDGGRSLSHWPLGMSIFATWMSNIAIISLPALVYSTNWSYFIMFIGVPISALFVIKILIPIYRKEGSISAYSFLGKKFGSWAPFYCVICYALTNLFRLGIIMYLMATSIGYLSGFEEKWIILIIGGVVVLYTFMGGLGCVIFTDVIQAILFFVGTLVLLIFIAYSLPFTLEDAIIYANKNGKFNFGSSDMSLFKPTIWILGLNSLLFNFQGLGTEQGFVQRYMAAKNKRCAKKSVIIGALLIFIFSTILFIIGTLLFSYYHYNLDTIGYIIFDEHIILRYVADHIPSGLKGIIIVTIMAAAMSSIDSELNAIATIFYKHIYKKIFRKSQLDSKPLHVLYKSSIIFGIIPILISFLMIEKSNLLDTWNNFDSLFSGSILGLFMLALIIKKSEKNTALIAAISSSLVIAWLVLSQTLDHPLFNAIKSPMHSSFNILLLLFTMFIAGYATHIINKGNRNKLALK